MVNTKLIARRAVIKAKRNALKKYSQKDALQTPKELKESVAKYAMAKYEAHQHFENFWQELIDNASDENEADWIKSYWQSYVQKELDDNAFDMALIAVVDLIIGLKNYRGDE